MARRFKLPKRINGYKLPKAPRKAANRVLAQVKGEEVEALVGVVLGAMIAHFADREGGTRLTERLREAVGSHLAH